MPSLTPEQKIRACVALHGDPALAQEEVKQELLEERETTLSYSDSDAFIAACATYNLLVGVNADTSQRRSVRWDAGFAAESLERFIEGHDLAEAAVFIEEDEAPTDEPTEADYVQEWATDLLDAVLARRTAEAVLIESEGHTDAAKAYYAATRRIDALTAPE